MILIDGIAPETVVLDPKRIGHPAEIDLQFAQERKTQNRPTVTTSSSMLNLFVPVDWKVNEGTDLIAAFGNYQGWLVRTNEETAVVADTEIGAIRQEPPKHITIAENGFRALLVLSRRAKDGDEYVAIESRIIAELAAKGVTAIPGVPRSFVLQGAGYRRCIGLETKSDPSEADAPPAEAINTPENFGMPSAEQVRLSLWSEHHPMEPIECVNPKWGPGAGPALAASAVSATPAAIGPIVPATPKTASSNVA